MAAPAANNNNDDYNDDNNSQVWAKCTGCGTIYNANERLSSCLICGSNQRELIGVKTESVKIKEQLSTQLKTEKRNSRWFYLTVGVTMGAPFTALIPNLHPVVGIAIGLAFGYASLRLGKRAYTIIIRMYESKSG